MQFPPGMQSLSVAWFDEADWGRWREIDSDFEPDYHQWLLRAERAFKHYQAAGQHMVKVIIEPAEFIEWSRVNGGEVNSLARANFAAWKTMVKSTGH